MDGAGPVWWSVLCQRSRSRGRRASAARRRRWELVREWLGPAEGRLSCLEIATKLVWLNFLRFGLSVGASRMSAWGRE